jgi:hypothetical protein
VYFVYIFVNIFSHKRIYFRDSFPNTYSASEMQIKIASISSDIKFSFSKGCANPKKQRYLYLRIQQNAFLQVEQYGTLSDRIQLKYGDFRPGNNDSISILQCRMCAVSVPCDEHALYDHRLCALTMQYLLYTIEAPNMHN